MKKLVFSLLMVALTLSATNGMSVIGLSSRAASLGGTNLILNSPHNISCNPAVMGFATESSVAFDLGLMIPTVHFTNDLNDTDSDDQIFPLPTLSYLHKSSNSKFNFGFSAFAQGGMGATYDLKHDLYYTIDQTTGQMFKDSLNTQKYHSQIAYMKMVPAVSYNVNKDFSIGLAPSIGYAMLEMKMPYSMPTSAMNGAIPTAALQGFPGGSTFGDMFAAPNTQGGLAYEEVTATADMEDGVTAIGYGATIGFNYRVSDDFIVGLTYTSASTLTFEGDAEMDMTQMFGDAYGRMMENTIGYMAANGMIADPQNPTPEEMAQAQGMVDGGISAMEIDMQKGMVAEYDAEVEMSWPQQLDLAIRYAPTKNTTIYSNIKWINWEGAMDRFKMTMKNGSNSNINKMMGSEDIRMDMPLNWEDQIVFAVGVEQTINEMFIGRLGYNFGKNPVPEETVIPIFPAVVEHHITAGFGIALNKKIDIDFGYEFVVENEVEADQSIIANEYDGSKSSLSEHLLHFGLKYNF